MFRYAFMFPVTTVIALLCQSAGIGGGALLSPFLLLVFPLIGPDVPLASPAAAIASSLLTEVWGFASGLSGYWRRGLVDWKVALSLAGLSMPAAWTGARVILPLVADRTAVLQTVYAVTMLGLCAFLLLSEKPGEELGGEECEIPAATEENLCTREKTAADGTVYTYMEADAVLGPSSIFTVAGGTLTGLLGVGIGEVVVPQLVRNLRMPGPVASGTSVAVVVLTAVTAATVQLSTLANNLAATNPDLSFLEAIQQVMPWGLVQYTVPGAVLGGQIAPYLISKRVIDDEAIESFVAGVFGVVGLAFAAKVVFGS